MPSTLRTPASTPRLRRRQSVLLCVVVGVLAAVGWVLYRHYLMDNLSRRAYTLFHVGTRLWATTLVIDLLLVVPYALVLFLWGQGLVRATSGAAVAVVAGLFVWGWDLVYQSYVFSPASAGTTQLRLYVWGSLLVTAVLVPLAWGVARRSGSRWPLGLVVGPVVAAALRELTQSSTWWQAHVSRLGPGFHWQLEALVFMTPFVLAVLACWALESVLEPSEIGSSA